MTRAIIRAMVTGISNQGWKLVGHGGSFANAVAPIEAYIQKRVAKAVAAEREACAKVCDEYGQAKYAASAIRARGNK